MTAEEMEICQDQINVLDMLNEKTEQQMSRADQVVSPLKLSHLKSDEECKQKIGPGSDN